MKYSLRYGLFIVVGAVIVIVASFAFFFNLSNQSALISYAFTLDERGQLPGEYTGIGTSFDIQRSQYKDILVTFDKETQASIESITGMIGIRIELSSSSKELAISITIDNLEPNTTYYKYVDHLDTREDITTDETGSITFNQDVSQAPYIMIFEHPSTYFIEDGGGDCNTIGTWDGGTKTCTLAGNIDQSIEIKDNGITLDGDNHTVQGPESNIGVFVNGGTFGDITDVTVKNIVVTGFSKGLQISNTNRVHLINITAQNNSDGVEFHRAENSSITQSTITSNTGKGLIVGNSSDINDVSINTITNNNVGIDLGLNSQSSITRNDITGNGTGMGIGAIGGANTFLWRNNIDNTQQISIFADGDTQFYKEWPNRGNYWADHSPPTCIQDTVNPNECTNRYTIPRPLFSDKYDEYPWACEDAWETGVDCAVVTPTPTVTATPTPPVSGTWGEIDSPTGTVKIYMDFILDEARVHKILPNDWILKILDDSGSVWQVEDVTDSTVGWIESSLIVDVTRDSSFAEVDPRSLSERKGIIYDSVKHYLSNNDSAMSLYSSQNSSNDFQKLINAGVVSELVLGIATAETEIVNYDNDFTSYDFGLGIMQLTTKSLVGMGSHVNVPVCDEKSEEPACFTDTYRRPILNSSFTFPGRDYISYHTYNNSVQSFYANIKDGIRTLQQKYEWAVAKFNSDPRTSYVSSRTGESIDKKHMKLLYATRGYNAIGSGCYPLFNNINPDYLADVKVGFENAGEEFAIPLSERSDLTALSSAFDIAVREQQYISACSPIYLQIRNSAGQVTGYDGSTFRDEIPEVVMDRDTYRHASILLDMGDYEFIVIGFGEGTYSLPAGTMYFGSEVHFSALDIPITAGEIHIYEFDWDKLSKGEKGTTVSVDFEGDGVIDVEFKSDTELTAEEFEEASKKITICHIPPGNPSNAHIITIGAPALKAHLKHGDYEGECDEVL
ncbi:MAG: NosD domain-containing protein [Parcubacteria group bacterium]